MMQQAAWLSVIRIVQAAGWDEATLNKMLVIELNNGRTTYMGILALMVHEKLNNNPYTINSLLGFPVPC